MLGHGSSFRPTFASDHTEPMTRIFDDDLAGGMATRVIHAGQRPDPVSGAIMTPLYLTSTYVQESIGVNKGYEYARGKNPTRQALERNVAILEGGTHGFAFGSGMGCLDSIMKLFRAGDHIVCGENVYGGTFRLFDRILRHFGLSFTYVDTDDPQRVADAMTPSTRALLVETPTNPLMRLTDLAAMRSVADKFNKDAKVDEPLVPVDLVVDHSVHIDNYGTANALDLNREGLPGRGLGPTAPECNQPDQGQHGS